jgi:hypothetical protein
MIKVLIFALALAASLLLQPAIAASQFYKCNINGSMHYQQSPCASNEARRPPTVEELNAERQKHLAEEKEHPAIPKPNARPSESSEPFEKARGNQSVAPSGAFKCDSRKFCSQMTSCSEAKYFLSNCQGVKMDGDRNGIPCEQQWCNH